MSDKFKTHLVDRRGNKSLLVILAIFLFLYALISLVNHYCFRTYALDLGDYTNALWDYAHFHLNYSQAITETPQNILGDHFDLYLVVFSPLVYLFGTYTLLIIQIAAIIFGAYGVFRYFKLDENQTDKAWIPTLYFLLFFGVFAAVAFDYHSNVVAACLLPWFFVSLKKRRLSSTILWLLAIIAAKENMSLWMIFVSLGCVWNYRKDKKLTRLLLFSAIISLAYFVTITFYIIPWISDLKGYSHFQYSYLGKGPIEAIKFIFLHPITTIKGLFINQTSNIHANGVKMELHIFLLLSGLPILFWKPQYIFMLIPIYFQKLFNDDYRMWGFSDQYSIEFAPIMAIGIFEVIRAVKRHQMLSILVLLLTAFVTIHSMDSTILFTNKLRIRFYQAGHYKRDYPIEKVHNFLSKIPSNVAVSAQSPFVPHLALRNKIYCFPIVKDADIIVLSRKEEPYPLTKLEFDSLYNSLLNSHQWRISVNTDYLTEFRKVD